MERKQWTLLVVATAGGQPVEPVQIQKSLFILSRKIPEKLGVEAFYEFEPYDYGPFCAEVYHDAEVLEQEGLLRIIRNRYKEYVATPSGLEEAERLHREIDSEVWGYLQKIVSW